MDQHQMLPQMSGRPTKDLTDPGTTTISITATTQHLNLNTPVSSEKLNPEAVLDSLTDSSRHFSLTHSLSSTHNLEKWWTGKYDFAAKIIVLGDYGVGKSAFLNTLGGVKGLAWYRCLAFQTNQYVEVECVQNVNKILIRVMDTGGQERFRSMTSSYFRGAHACLLMYNVNNEESFNNVSNWYHDLSLYTPPDNISNISAMLVGVTSRDDRERVVTAERAFQLAESLKVTYCETHVRDEQKVLCIVMRLVNHVIVSRVRRQSLAIHITPPPLAINVEKKAKKRPGCCRTS